MDPSRLEALPDELLLRIGTELAGMEPYASYALWSMCMVSKRLNGPATKTLYDNVSLNEYNVRSFLRTVDENRTQAKSIRKLRVTETGIDPAGGSLDVVSSYSNAQQSSMIIRRLARDMHLDEKLFVRLSNRYGKSEMVAGAELCASLLLLTGLRSLDVDMSLQYDFACGLLYMDPDLSLRFFCQLIDGAEIAESSFEVEAPMWGVCQNLREIALQAPRSSDSYDYAAATTIRSIATILRIKTLRRLELTRFATEEEEETDMNGVMHHFLDKTSIAVDHELEYLAIYECLLSKKHVAELVGKSPTLKTFVWTCPVLTAMESEDSREGYCLRAADIGQALYTQRESLKHLSFTGLPELELVEQSQFWSRTWKKYKRHVAPFGFSEVSDAASLRSHLAKPMNLSDFKQLRSLHTRACDVVKISGGANDSVSFDLRGSLPALLQSLELDCWPVYIPDNELFGMARPSHQIKQIVRGISIALANNEHLSQLRKLSVLLSNIGKVDRGRPSSTSTYKSGLSKLVAQRKGLHIEVKASDPKWSYDSTL